MVSHFWAPVANDAPLSVSTRRTPGHDLDDLQRRRSPDDVTEDEDDDEAPAAEVPAMVLRHVTKKRPIAEWFLVQLRRRRGHLREGDVEDDGQLWQEGEELSGVDPHSGR